MSCLRAALRSFASAKSSMNPTSPAAECGVASTTTARAASETLINQTVARRIVSLGQGVGAHTRASGGRGRVSGYQPDETAMCRDGKGFRKCWKAHLCDAGAKNLPPSPSLGGKGWHRVRLL